MTSRHGVQRRIVMSSSEIDAYLENAPDDQREALSVLRARILSSVPGAEEGISYRVPAFRVEGAVVAGFASFTSHMSYLPFSGSVLDQLSDEIAAFTHTKSSLHFSTDNPLSEDLVKRLITVRWDEIRRRGR
jgi:uncharacterized protein YdhG (YjbR/CyaY superfamily)